MKWEEQIMRSKISFFNRTIFRKNITHFWPIWVLYSILCIWSMPIYSYFNLRNYNGAGLTATEQSYMKVINALDGFDLSMSAWVIFIFSISSAVAVFSYLYTSRSVNMIHALPVRREELFVTNYLSGILFMLIPQLVSFLITVFIWFGNGINHLEYLLQWLGIVTGETFFAYSLGVFCVMLTGNIVAAPAYFVLINYMYKGIWSIWNMVRQALIYGFTGNSEVYGLGLVPFEYFREKVGVVYPEGAGLKLPTIEGMSCLKWYVLAGVIFAVVALIIYRKRQLECAGDMIVISWIKPVVRWFGAILCAGLTGELVQTTFFTEKVLMGKAFPVLLGCWIVVGVLSFFGIEMIIEKQFKIFNKGLVAQCGVLVVLMVLFLGSLEKDVFQLEKQLPKVKDVAEVYVQGSYQRYITEPEKIKENIKLQKNIIASRDEYQQYFRKYYGKNECNYLMVDMTYITKTGKKQTWSYNLPIDDYYVKEEGSAVKELQEQEANYEDYMTYYFTEQYGNIELQSGSCFDWVDDEGNFQSIDISTEDAQGLVEAFKQDIASGEYCIYPYGEKERVKNTYVNTLTICYTPPKGAHLLQYGVDATTTWDIADGRTVEYTGIILTKACKNTIAQLEKMGYVDEKHKLMTEEVFQSIFDSEDIY